MAKIQIKSEKLTPFGGIFSIMEQFDTALSFKNALFSRKASYFIGGGMSEWERRFPYSFL